MNDRMGGCVQSFTQAHADPGRPFWAVTRKDDGWAGASSLVQATESNKDFLTPKLL